MSECTQYQYTQKSDRDFPTAVTPCEVCNTPLESHLSRPWGPPQPAEEPPSREPPECLNFGFDPSPEMPRPGIDSPCINCGVSLGEHPFGARPVMEKRLVPRQGTPVQRQNDNGPQGVPPTIAPPSMPRPVQVMKKPDAMADHKMPARLPADPREANRYQVQTMPGQMIYIGLPIQSLPLRDAINVHYWLGQSIREIQERVSNGSR